MTNDERDLTPENIDDDLRYAPPPEPVLPEADPVAIEANNPDEMPVELAEPEMIPAAEGVDIEAALAAVSSLSDMLAEQEAAEQARLAQIEAETQAAAERQARLEHPEQFFAVPPFMLLRRGQMASVVPALLLMAIGAWLTFTLTTNQTPPDAGLLAGVVVGAGGLTLLARWLSSGRWARGTLFIALATLLLALASLALLQPGTPGLDKSWPLLSVALGMAFILTGLFAYPHDRRVILPGALLITGGLAALVVTLGLLDTALLATIGTLWPLALALVAFVLLIPLVVRQRG